MRKYCSTTQDTPVQKAGYVPRTWLSVRVVVSVVILQFFHQGQKPMQSHISIHVIKEVMKATSTVSYSAVQMQVLCMHHDVRSRKGPSGPPWVFQLRCAKISHVRQIPPERTPEMDPKPGVAEERKLRSING